MADPGHWLRSRLASHEDRLALILGERRHRYAELAARTRVCLAFLREHDVGAGQVVALLADYSLTSIAMLLALAEHKSIAVPITTRVADEVQKRLEEGGVERIVRVSEAGEPTLEDRGTRSQTHALIARLREAGRAGLILFSSGSSGVPKAMVHDLDTLMGVYASKKSRRQVVLVFLMFDHIGGLNTLLNGLAMGLTMVFSASRDAMAVARLIEQHQVRLLPTTPTFLNLMLLGQVQDACDLRSLRIITYGTEPMPQSLLTRLKAAFPRVRFIQTFGTSETGINKTQSRSSESNFFKLCDDDGEHRIVDGELWLRSPTQILGYLNHSMERFTDDGWFRTGDLVEEAEDGYLRVVGRRTEMINVGGEKVLPGEVESVLLECDGVRDCRVYGADHVLTGEMVVAEVATSWPDPPREVRKRLRAHCASRLERYKVPAKFHLLDAISVSDRFKKVRRGTGSSGP